MNSLVKLKDLMAIRTRPSKRGPGVEPWQGGITTGPDLWPPMALCCSINHKFIWQHLWYSACVTMPLLGICNVLLEVSIAKQMMFIYAQSYHFVLLSIPTRFTNKHHKCPHKVLVIIMQPMNYLRSYNIHASGSKTKKDSYGGVIGNLIKV